jgi:hypothetical protein
MIKNWLSVKLRERGQQESAISPTDVGRSFGEPAFPFAEGVSIA